MTVLCEVDLTDIEVGEFDAFMEEAKRFSPNSVARVMESIVSGVNFHRCGKRHMAEVWAARDRADFRRYGLAGKSINHLKAAFDTERQYQQDRMPFRVRLSGRVRKAKA